MLINWNTLENQKMLVDVNAAVLKAINELRVTQKSIPSIDFIEKNLSGVPDNRIDFRERTIPDRSNKAFVELSLKFSLSEPGVNTSERLKDLAVALVPALALTEDFYIFQMSEKSHSSRDKNHPGYPVPFGVRISNWQIEDGYRDYGLLSEAHPAETSDCDWAKVSTPIHVPLLPEGSETLWGMETARAVLKGIAKLMSKTGKGNKGFALFLPIEVWADAMLLGADEDFTTTSLINRTGLDIEVLPCRVLPKDEGLLVNLVGDPIKIYYAQQPEVEPEESKDGKYYFRMVERVRYMVIDPRALVLLKFQQPSHRQKQHD